MPRLAAMEYARKSDTVRPRSGGHGILATRPRAKCASADDFIVAS